MTLCTTTDNTDVTDTMMLILSVLAILSVYVFAGGDPKSKGIAAPPTPSKWGYADASTGGFLDEVAHVRTSVMGSAPTGVSFRQFCRVITGARGSDGEWLTTI